MENSTNRQLKSARIKAGFKSASAACQRFGWNASTYRSHENGQTPIPVKWVKRYARAFGVTPGSLLLFNNTVSIEQLMQRLHRKSADTQRLARRLLGVVLEESD